MANLTAIHAAVTLTTAAQNVITAITNPTFCRTLSITGTAGGSLALSGNVILTGTDANGEALTETFALDGSNTVPGKSGFLTVTNIALPVRVNTDDTVSVGVATQLFGIAEARAHNRAELNSPTTYPVVTILAAEQEIREAFEEVCNVSFIARTQTNYYIDGTGSKTLWLPFMRPLAVTAGVIYDDDLTTEETFDATDLADLALYDDGRVIRRTEGTWLKGNKNVKLTFSHGYGVCPLEVRRAALSVCLAKLVPSDISDRATYASDGNMTFGLSTAGRFGAEYGMPMVDSILARYSHRVPAIA